MPVRTLICIICRCYYTIQHHLGFCGSPLDINNQLRLADSQGVVVKRWKINFIVLHAIDKNVEGWIQELQMNNVIIERVGNFYFPVLTFNEHAFWKHLIDTIANKLTRFSGILNKWKLFLWGYILRTLYFSMFLSRLMYGILACGFDYQRSSKYRSISLELFH